jgi:4-hydroxybenzoate polyprenyltransferase
VTESKWFTYCRLMRINKPIGALLLLWPTLAALWLAARGTPDVFILLVFVCGVFLMRSAGCVINDFADRHIDGHVKRTNGRPLPNGQVTEKESKLLFFVLVLISFLLVMTLNQLTIILSVGALALAWLYPFMKRVTHLPQLILGVAFSWSIPMGYAAITDSLPISCWVLLMANLFWTVAYDTQYAMVDRQDDIRIGVKSTAILFGRYDKLIVAILQLLTLAMLVLLAQLNGLSAGFYWALLVIGAMFVYQQRLLVNREPDKCFQAFMNNNYVGVVMFIGILISL